MFNSLASSSLSATSSLRSRWRDCFLFGLFLHFGLSITIVYTILFSTFNDFIDLSLVFLFWINSSFQSRVLLLWNILGLFTLGFLSMCCLKERCSWGPQRHILATYSSTLKIRTHISSWIWTTFKQPNPSSLWREFISILLISMRTFRKILVRFIRFNNSLIWLS